MAQGKSTLRLPIVIGGLVHQIPQIPSPGAYAICAIWGVGGEPGNRAEQGGTAYAAWGITRSQVRLGKSFSSAFWQFGLAIYLFVASLCCQFVES